MRKFVIAFGILFVGQDAFAANWVKFASTDDYVEYMDMATIHKSLPYTAVWTKSDFREKSKNDNQVTLWDIDCNGKRLAVKQGALYKIAGRTPETFNVPDRLLEFQAAVPDSVNEARIALACK